MNKHIFIFFLCFASSAYCAELWNFHFEAEKGSRAVEIPKAPKTLESFLFESPVFSPDPLTSNERIAGSEIRKIGELSRQPIIEIRSQITGGYYTHIYILLLGTSAGGYLPLYAQQYNSGVRTPKLTDVIQRDRELALYVRVDYSGTGAHYTLDEVLLIANDDSHISLKTKRK